jgi:hypothetical protein
MEVILAIAILGGSLAVLGELVRIGARASRSARLLSSAQLLADSLAAEVTSGVTMPESTEGVVQQFAGADWSYTIQVEQIEQQGLLGVWVTVQEMSAATERPTTYSLVRWMIDPEVELEMEMAAEEMAASASGTEGEGQASGSGQDEASGGNGSGTGMTGGR